MLMGSKSKVPLDYTKKKYTEKRAWASPSETPNHGFIEALLVLL
jgi:hypothetical protein